MSTFKKGVDDLSLCEGLSKASGTYWDPKTVGIREGEKREGREERAEEGKAGGEVGRRERVRKEAGRGLS